jgi:hypothetical protein
MWYSELRIKGLAEREGFEPPVPFRVRRFSRPEPSTTRPPLRLLQVYKARFGRLVSLQQFGCISVLGQQAECFGMKLHDLGKVGEKIGQAVIAGVGMIFVLYGFFQEFVM